MSRDTCQLLPPEVAEQYAHTFESEYWLPDTFLGDFSLPEDKTNQPQVTTVQSVSDMFFKERAGIEVQRTADMNAGEEFIAAQFSPMDLVQATYEAASVRQRPRMHRSHLSVSSFSVERPTGFSIESRHPDRCAMYMRQTALHVLVRAEHGGLVALPLEARGLLQSGARVTNNEMWWFSSSRPTQRYPELFMLCRSPKSLRSGWNIGSTYTRSEPSDRTIDHFDGTFYLRILRTEVFTPLKRAKPPTGKCVTNPGLRTRTLVPSGSLGFAGA